MSGEQHPEKDRDCFITIRRDEFASQRNGDQLMKLYAANDFPSISKNPPL